ncbi:MAG: hypothetical protein RL367_469, partial [Pseudomonadota bacterium]
MRAKSLILTATAMTLLLASGSAPAQRKPAAKPAAAVPVATRPAPGPAPKARYAMDVSTDTGLAAMGGGMGGGLGMMFGGGRGDKEIHSIDLRLGSTLAPTGGEARADHFLLPAAKMGKSVPLVTPERTPVGPRGEFRRPKGRMFLFWGCGAHAAKGQPIIIDFAKIAAGQIPPGLGYGADARVPIDSGPTESNSRTYGHWPNGKGGKPPGPGSSLIGDHRIAGNYAPEIKFALAQDYMPGVQLQSQQQASGAIDLRWNQVAPATGYFAWVMGFNFGSGGPSQDGPQDMVWWSSAASRAFGGGLTDWLPPAAVERLIADKTVMPPSQTSCTVPAEVKATASNMMMGSLYAYGPEANFSWPPRPTTPGTPWVLDWTAKVRYRSMANTLLISPMAGMSGGGAGQQQEC